MSFDVIMIKSLPAGGGNVQKAAVNPAAKKYVSTSGKPLSDASIAKAKELEAHIQKMGPFAGVYSAESKTSYQTAMYATGGTEEANVVQVHPGFNQIRLGVFESSEAGAIQKAYAEAHPEARFVPEPNDCLNKPWPGYAVDAFEPYEAVDERVLKAFASLNLESRLENPVFVVSAAKEPVRSVMLHSALGETMRSSQFYKDLVVHIQKEPSADQPLGELAVRGQLNPKDGSWIRVRYEGGKSSIVDVSKDVEFRKAPPVPGYFK